jgi:shikimate kinase
VIALGGGAVVAEENRALLRSKGTLVWLDARPETLVERIGEAAERPLLAGLDRTARVAKLAALRDSRAAAYATALHHIETDGRSADQVCAAVLAALESGAAA